MKLPHLAGDAAQRGEKCKTQNQPALTARPSLIIRSRMYNPISCFCCLKHVTSDALSIRGADEVSCFRLCKKVETVSEYGAPFIFEIAMMSPEFFERIFKQ